MTHVVCQVLAQTDEITFTWSTGPAFFQPYRIQGQGLIDFHSHVQDAREHLANLVKDVNHGAEGEVRRTSFQLAEAGYQLYRQIFLPDASQRHTANEIRKWLNTLRNHNAIEALEIVVEGIHSVPWNIVYDQKPEEHLFLEEPAGLEQWKPFWGVRYNLAGGRRVEPLRRLPIWEKPRVIMVVDPDVRRELGVASPEDEKKLVEFANSRDIPVLESKNRLAAVLQIGRPDLIYWLGHASPRALILKDQEIRPTDLKAMFEGDDFEDAAQVGGLVFLNACQTAQTSEIGSFLDALHECGLSGLIATEEQTIDTFANPLGLDFLKAFLDEGESIGKIMHRLRGRVPLGLLYGTYCPPEISVRCQGDNRVEPAPVVTPIGQVGGRALQASGDSEGSLPPLPDHPYRSLAYYTAEDRALFAGRDDDTLRFTRLLDQPKTQIMILHGESGVGKSSFLRAGVVPFLEEECTGFRFVRSADSGSEPVLFIRATNDLTSQLAQSLCTYCSQAVKFPTPKGKHVIVDLPGILEKEIGDRPTVPLVRAALRDNREKLGEILGAISQELPYALLLIIDQAEEVFTLVKNEKEAENRRLALQMLHATVSANGNFKVILSLRTEHYGRLVDRIRRGPEAVEGIREYLLTDFSRENLLKAILRPTSDCLIPYSSEVPRQKYGFHFTEGVAEEIADRVIQHSINKQDSVLPLVQVICSQLYERVEGREEPGITPEDLQRIGGVEGGMKKHVKTVVAQQFPHRVDRRAFRKLLALTPLYLRQPDGTLTTALVPKEELEGRWKGRMPFAEMLKGCAEGDLRLLRVSSLRIGGEQERDYVSLGHDAMAKVVAAWERELKRNARRIRSIVVFSTVAGIAVIMGVLMLIAWDQKKRADASAQQAIKAHEKFEISLAENLMRPLGYPGAINESEWASLWTLAMLESGDVRRRFVEQALSNPDTARRFERRITRAMHAATGLNENHRRSIIQAIKKIISDPKSPLRIRTACISCGTELQLSDRAFTDHSVRAFKEVTGNRNSFYLLEPLARKIKIISRSLPEPQKLPLFSQAAQALIQRMVKTERSEELAELGAAFAIFSEDLPGDKQGPVGAVGDHLTGLVQKHRQNGRELYHLSRGYAGIAEAIPNEGKRKMAGLLCPMVAEQTDPLSASNLLPALLSVAPHLSIAQSVEVARALVQLWLKTRKGETAYSELLNGIRALINKLPSSASNAVIRDQMLLLRKKLAQSKLTERTVQMLLLFEAIARRLPPAQIVAFADSSLEHLMKLIQPAPRPWNAEHYFQEGVGLILKSLPSDELGIVLQSLAEKMNEPGVDEGLKLAVGKHLTKATQRLPAPRSRSIVNEVVSLLDSGLTSTEAANRITSSDAYRIREWVQQVIAIRTLEEGTRITSVIERCLLYLFDVLKTMKKKNQGFFPQKELLESLLLLSNHTAPDEAGRLLHSIKDLIQGLSEMELVILKDLLQSFTVLADRANRRMVPPATLKWIRTEIHNPKNPDPVFRALISAVLSLSGGLSEKDGDSILKQIQIRLDREDIPLQGIRALAMSLSVLGQRLPRQKTAPTATEVVKLIFEALTSTNEASGLGTLGDGIAAIAPLLSEDEAGKRIKELGRIMTQSENSSMLAGLANGLEGLAKQAKPEITSATTYRLCQHLANYQYAMHISKQVFPHLSNQHLVDALKWPTAVGEYRELLLDQCRSRFKNDLSSHWDLVEWLRAHEKEIDLTTPPKRFVSSITYTTMTR